MKFFKLLLYLILSSLLSFNSMSQEVLMDSSNMNIINDGSVIIADDAEIFVPLEKIKVEADKAKCFI